MHLVVRTRWREVALAVCLAAGLAACGTPALGDDHLPALLDPNSPRLSARDIAFDRAEVDVPAGAPFVLVFENRDSVSHNVSIYTDDTFANRRFEGAIFGGPATRWYPVPALAAGTYTFRCDLHPDMKGRLVAG
jgi:plastocyanin